MSAVGATGGAGGTAGAPEPRHGRRIAVIWAVATVIVVPLVIWVVGPHIPPYHVSDQASDQHSVNVVLTALAAPVLLFIWVYFGYAVVNFRQRGDELLDGPPIEGNPRIQLTWLAVTSAIVLGLAVYGTVALFGEEGAGGGQGPNPIAKPPAAALAGALQVQVIGQQWLWTFRYPGYGGVETPEALEIPANRWVVFHVTSLDVAHSFWAYELAIKADAIPGNDNVTYAKATQTRSFQIRCAELCGLWHGHMTSAGRVVSPSEFATWITAQQVRYRGVTRYLPPYSHVYYPQPIRRAG